MIVALIDNGSLEPAAHRNLRALAAALSARVGTRVHAVSWKHSDRLRLAVLDNQPAWTLASWVRAHFEAGEREFVLVPFFISAQGAIGSALRTDLEKLQAALGPFSFTFTAGLAARGALAEIVTDRIRATLAARKLWHPPVIVVDHGGPSPVSAELRNTVAADVRATLARADEIGPLAAASMEGAEFAHNQPLFADQLAQGGFDRGDVVIAPLFLAPGRHAGPQGDLAQIARAAERAAAGEQRAEPLRCHFTELIGTHPRVVDVLADALRATLASFPAETLA
jgi:sirohydrochlorin ferrochelatase